MSSITTRAGDKGTTFLFSGEEVPKNSPRTEAYGDLDELVSALGLARACAANEDVQAAVLYLQQKLFVVGSELATSLAHITSLRERITPELLDELDRKREALERRITMPEGFIIPGETRGGAHLDMARAIARRCERKVSMLARDGLVDNKYLLVWMNRLSDYLWLLARLEEGGRSRPK